MKISILFHSHMRSFRNTHIPFKTKVVETLENAGHDCDIFIHTWDKEEFTTKTWHKGTKNIKDTCEDEIISCYNPKKLQIETQALENVKRKIFNRPYDALKSVWYSAYKTFEMMKDYEEKNNIRYEAVIVTRPDVQHFSNIFIDEIEDISKLWQCQVYKKTAASDVFLFGGRKLAEEAICKFYLEFDNLHKHENLIKFTNNEYVFNEFIRSKTNVDISQYCMPRDWRILRSWWKPNHIVGHKKWDREAAVKEIKENNRYTYFRRRDDK